MSSFVLGIVSALLGLIALVSFLVFVNDLPKEKGNAPAVWIVAIACVWLLYLGWSMFSGMPD